MLEVMLSEPVRRELDLDAVARNHARTVARLAPGTNVIGSVKANAYGHGVLEVARVLEVLGVDGVATASVREAVELRDHGLRCRILLFAGTYDASDLPELVQREITVTVANADTARMLAERHLNPSVFVKVDCGLGRLGLPPDETEQLLRVLRLRCQLNVEGLYTHLPFGDPSDEAWARHGLERFRVLVGRLRAGGFEFPIVQALSSPGISAGLPMIGNAVCPGRILYGLPPSVGTARDWGLEPVLRTVRTRITHVRTHRTDAWIGAGGHSHVAAGETTAVIPFGRSAGNFTDVSLAPYVLHRQARARVISVSLEHATLNLGSASAEIGDEVTILGGGEHGVSLEELAGWSHLDPLAVLIGLDRRPGVVIA